MRPLELLRFVKDFLYRRTNWLAFGVGLTFLSGALIQSWTRPLWNDEYFTAAVAEQASTSAMFHALDQGVDLNPPLFHLATRLSTQALGMNRLGLRLPAVLGFTVMLVAIYLFVSGAFPGYRGRICGLTAMMIPVLTGMEYYASEGRAYGLMLGFVSVSLLFWQGSERNWVRALFCGLTFACAVLTHAYAIFVLGPMILAEVVRSLASRRWNWSFLIVPFSGLVSSALVFQHLQRGATANSNDSAASSLDIELFYAQVIQPLSTEIVIILALFAGFWFFIRLEPDSSTNGGREESISPTYVALGLGLFLLPFAIIPLSAAAKLPFTFRYALVGGIGFAFISVGLLLQLDRWRSGSLLIGFAVFASGFAVHDARIFGRYIQNHGPIQDRPAFEDPEAKLLPIFAQDPYLYVEMLFTWPAEKRANLHYVLDYAMVRQMIGPTVADANLTQLFSVREMNVETYAELRQRPGKFLLYYDTSASREAIKGWLLKKLIDDGAPVQLLRRHGDILVYLVTTPGSV